MKTRVLGKDLKHRAGLYGVADSLAAEGIDTQMFWIGTNPRPLGGSIGNGAYMADIVNRSSQSPEDFFIYSYLLLPLRVNFQ